MAQRWTVSTGRRVSKGVMSWSPALDNPELTFSARILRSMIDEGIGGTEKRSVRLVIRYAKSRWRFWLWKKKAIAETTLQYVVSRRLRRRIPSRLPRGLRNTPDPRKGHSRSRTSPLKTGMMITNARLHIPDLAPEQRVQLILPSEDQMPLLDSFAVDHTRTSAGGPSKR